MEVGNYEIIRKLAVGGMAEIFLARQKAIAGFQRNVVLKRILPEYAADPAFVAAFLNEAKLTAQLSHSNLVQIFDFGQQDGTYFLTMEYIKGFDLEAILRVSPNGLALPIVLILGRDVAAGLDHAHEACDPDGAPLGIIHRDISPANVLVTMEGVAKVVDFGVAKATELNGTRTATGQVKGKAAYLAPEQILGLPLDRRVDVFALGAMLYECMTGQNPFTGGTDFESLTNVVEKEPARLPGPIGEVIARALAKERDERLQSCGEVMLALEHVAVHAKIALSQAPVRALVTAHSAQLEKESERERDERQAERAQADTRLNLAVPQAKPATAKMVMRANVRREVFVTLAIVLAVVFIVIVVWWPRPHLKTAVVPLAAAVEAAPLAQPVPAAVVSLTPEHPLVLQTPKPTAVKPVAVAKSPTPVVTRGEGRLRLVVQPYGALSIDGQEVGDIPRPPDTLSSGPHVVVISNADLGKKVTRKIVINPGEEVLIRENLLEH